MIKELKFHEIILLSNIFFQNSMNFDSLFRTECVQRFIVSNSMNFDSLFETKCVQWQRTFDLNAEYVQR